MLDNPRPNHIQIDEAIQRWGYSEEELSNMLPEDLDVVDEALAIPERLKKTIRDGSNIFETIHRTNNGTLIPTEVNGKIIELQGVRYLFCVSRDISERKEAVQALKKSEEKFSKFFFSCPTWSGFNRLDDGKFLEVNHAFERITGFTREETIGRTSLEMGLWSDTERREGLTLLPKIVKTQGYNASLHVILQG